MPFPKNCKRMIVPIILAMLITSLAGCTSSGKNTGGAAEASTGGSPSAAPAQKVTLKAFAVSGSREAAVAKTYNDIWCFQEAKRKTNIHIEWTHPPVGQGKEVANLLIASGDLPDFMMMNHTLVGGASKLLADKVIIKLNDVVEKNSPNLKKWLDQYPDVRKQLVMDDGAIYCYPFLRIKDDGNGKATWFSNGGYVMRADWLKKLNLKEPDTVEEMYGVLKAFKEKDPNGNGKADELPMIAQKTLNFLTPAWSVLDGFYDDKGVIRYGPLQPQYKEYLTTMAKWFKEGLIDPDYATTDSKMYQSKWVEGRAGMGNENAGMMATYTELVKKNNPDFELTGLKYLAASDGKRYTSLIDLKQQYMNVGSMITSKCKNVEATAKYLDWVYGEEGRRAFNWGEQDKSYVIKDSKPVFTDEVLKNPKGLPVDQALTQYAMSMVDYSIPKDPDYWVQIALRYPFQIAAIDKWGQSDNSLIMPPVSLLPDEVSKFTSIMNEVNTLKDEMVYKMIMGVDPLSKYDDMTQKFKQLGIEQAIKIQQDAYNRYNKR